MPTSDANRRVADQAPAAVRPGLRTPRRDTGDRPFLVIWEATQACPLACRHCRAEAKPYRDQRELSTAEAMELMRQVGDFGRPPPLFVITGGDPFQRPDLYQLVRYGTQLGLPTAVSPSGTPTLTRQALARLRDAGARAISLSLDAAGEKRHDAFRGVPGVYRWTADAWRAALDLGLKVQINTTVTRQTVHDLPGIASEVHQRGAQLWSVFLLVPTGRGRDLGALTAAETEDVLNAIYDVGETIPVKTTEAHQFRRICLQRRAIDARGGVPHEILGLGALYHDLRAQFAQSGLLAQAARVRRPPMQVSAARGFVFVSHVGSVHPTGFLPMSAGNIRDQSLAQIYRTSPLFTGIRDTATLGGRCGRCEFRQVCGGSRARAYAVTGDLLAEEPSCPYEPGSFPLLADLAGQLTGPEASCKGS